MTEALRQRAPRIRCEPYLAHVRTLPCLICGVSGVDPAHIRTASNDNGKRSTGGGEKADDKWALPLCRTHHDEQHDAGNETVFWKTYRIDPFAIAMRLWTAWKIATGYVASAKRPSAKSPFSKGRAPKLIADTEKAGSKPALQRPAKSPWPQRRGTLKSKSSFGKRSFPKRGQEAHD